eukprot:3905807-Pyramimonas_sp.AAC.1
MGRVALDEQRKESEKKCLVNAGMGYQVSGMSMCFAVPVAPVQIVGDAVAFAPVRAELHGILENASLNSHAPIFWAYSGSA